MVTTSTTIVMAHCQYAPHQDSSANLADSKSYGRSGGDTQKDEFRAQQNLEAAAAPAIFLTTLVDHPHLATNTSAGRRGGGGWWAPGAANAAAGGGGGQAASAILVLLPLLLLWHRHLVHPATADDDSRSELDK